MKKAVIPLFMGTAALALFLLVSEHRWQTKRDAREAMPATEVVSIKIYPAVDSAPVVCPATRTVVGGASAEKNEGDDEIAPITEEL